MWEEADNKLKESFQFKDFAEAFAFITKVAKLAEQENHHPRIVCEYNFVELELSTHDAGNKVTDKDRKMATAIDKLIS